MIRHANDVNQKRWRKQARGTRLSRALIAGKIGIARSIFLINLVLQSLKKSARACVNADRQNCDAHLIALAALIASAAPIARGSRGMRKMTVLSLMRRH